MSLGNFIYILKLKAKMEKTMIFRMRQHKIWLFTLSSSLSSHLGDLPSLGSPIIAKPSTEIRTSILSSGIPDHPQSEGVSELYPLSDEPGQIPISLKETTITHNQPTITTWPIPSALLLHGGLTGSQSFGNPWFSQQGKPAPYQSAEFLAGFSLTPYVPEGIPPVTLRFDAANRINKAKPSTFFSLNNLSLREDPAATEKELVFKHPAVQGKNVVLHGQLRMQVGLRDLNLAAKKNSVQNESQAFSLALPDGFMVAEVSAWGKQRIVKQEAALGYRLLNHQGLEIDLLLPQHLLVGYQFARSYSKLFILGKNKSFYRVPIISELTTSALLPDDAEKNEALLQDFPLERERRTQFTLGLQQKIFSVWHVSIEAGVGRTEWTLFRPSGNPHATERSRFGPYASIGIESLIPSFKDRSRAL